MRMERKKSAEAAVLILVNFLLDSSVGFYLDRFPPESESPGNPSFYDESEQGNSYPYLNDNRINDDPSGWPNEEYAPAYRSRDRQSIINSAYNRRRGRREEENFIAATSRNLSKSADPPPLAPMTTTTKLTTTSTTTTAATTLKESKSDASDAEVAKIDMAAIRRNDQAAVPVTEQDEPVQAIAVIPTDIENETGSEQAEVQMDPDPIPDVGLLPVTERSEPRGAMENHEHLSQVVAEINDELKTQQDKDRLDHQMEQEEVPVLPPNVPIITESEQSNLRQIHYPDQSDQYQKVQNQNPVQYQRLPKKPTLNEHEQLLISQGFNPNDPQVQDFLLGNEPQPKPGPVNGELGAPPPPGVDYNSHYQVEDVFDFADDDGKAKLQTKKKDGKGKNAASGSDLGHGKTLPSNTCTIFHTLVLIILAMLVYY